MIKNITKQKLTIFIILLIISMPLAISKNLSDFSNNLEEQNKDITEYERNFEDKKEQSTLAEENSEFNEITANAIEGFKESRAEYLSSKESPKNSITGQITVQYTPDDYKDRCVERQERTSTLIDMLDNEVIGAVEKVLSLMYLICSVMTTIDSVYSTIKFIIGSIPMPRCNSLLAPACIENDAEYLFFEGSFKSVVQPLCCFVTCGWCTGETCGGVVSTLGDAIGGSNLYDGTSASMMQLGPFDNIYTAMFCLCPTAILFNLKKLKTVYQTYDCCIEQSCEHGLDPEVCEKQLSFSTCMYWEGSVAMTAVNALSTIISGYVVKAVAELLVKMFGQGWIPWAMSVFELALIPGRIMGLTSSLDWFEKSFAEPNCEDLGFEDIKNEASRKVKVTCDDNGENCVANRPSDTYTVSDDGTKFIKQGLLQEKELSYISGKSDVDKAKRSLADIEALGYRVATKKEAELGIEVGDVLNKDGSVVEVSSMSDYDRGKIYDYYTNKLTSLNNGVSSLKNNNDDGSSLWSKLTFWKQDEEKKGKEIQKAPSKSEIEKKAQEEFKNTIKSARKLLKEDSKATEEYNKKLESLKIKSQGEILKFDTEEKEAELEILEKKNQLELAKESKDTIKQEIKDLEEKRDSAKDKASSARDVFNKEWDEKFPEDWQKDMAGKYLKASNSKQEEYYNILRDEMQKQQIILDSDSSSNQKKADAQSKIDSYQREANYIERATDLVGTGNDVAVELNLQNSRLEQEIRDKTDSNGVNLKEEAIKEKQKELDANNEKLAEIDPKGIAGLNEWEQARMDEIQDKMEQAFTKVLSKLLNEFAYDFVSDYCKDQWESSDTEKATIE